MKLLTLLLLITTFQVQAANSRIREGQSCEKMDQVSNTKMLISFKTDSSAEECDNGPHELTCREVQKYREISTMHCFGYNIESVNLNTKEGRSIKQVKRLVRIDFSGDCEIAPLVISKQISCSNNQSISKTKSISRQRIKDIDIGSKTPDEEPSINRNHSSYVPSNEDIKCLTNNTAKSKPTDGPITELGGQMFNRDLDDIAGLAIIERTRAYSPKLTRSQQTRNTEQFLLDRSIMDSIHGAYQ